MPDAVDTVVCAPDDGWRYHPKHVEQFPEINKLCNDTSRWIYIRIYLTMRGPMSVKKLEENFLQYRRTDKEKKNRLHLPILYSKIIPLNILLTVNCFTFTVRLLYSLLFSNFPTFAELGRITSNPEIAPCHC